MLLAFVFAAALDAAPAAQPTTAAPPAQATAKSEMICRYDNVTGTHLKQKICMTREQAEAASERDSREMDRMHHERTRERSGFSPAP